MTLTVSVARLKDPHAPRGFAAHETNIDGDKAADEATLAQVRAAFAACDADLPMLMLPLRIETRFQTAPYANPNDQISTDYLGNGVRLAAVYLDDVAVRPPPAGKVRGETPAQKKARKDAAREDLRTIVNALHRASRAAFAARRNVRSCIVTASEQAALAALTQYATALQNALAKATAHLAAYPIPYTRGRLGRLIAKLAAHDVNPLLAEVKAALLGMQLSASLAWTTTAAVSAACTAAAAALQTATAAANSVVAWPAARTAVNALIAATWAIARGADLPAITAQLADVRTRLVAFDAHVAPLAGSASVRTDVAGAVRQLGPIALVDAPRFSANAAALSSCRANLAELRRLLTDGHADTLAHRGAIIRVVEGVAASTRSLLVVPHTSTLPADLTTTLASVSPVPAAWRANAAGGSRELLSSVAQLERALESFAAAARALRLDAAPASDVSTEPRPIVLARDTSSRLRPELWVRIFPDQIFQTGHTATLDPAETAAGAQLQTDLAAAHGDAGVQLAAWQAFARRFGVRRAAWIYSRTKPNAQPVASAAPWEPVLFELGHAEQQLDAAALVPVTFEAIVDRLRANLANLAAPMPVDIGERVAGRLHGVLARVRYASARRTPPLTSVLDKLVATVRELPSKISAAPPPSLPLKSATMTAPHSSALPARFVVTTAQNGTVTHVVAGAPIDPAIALGLGSASDFALGADGALQVPAEVKWMFDFDAAVAAGMAVRVPISEAELHTGFDRVFVVGVPAGNGTVDQARVEALIEGHRYGPNGVALVPYASPTNSTEQQLAAWSSEDSAEEEWKRLTAAPPLVWTGDPTRDSDAVRWARACGVSPSLFANIAHATEHSLADAEIAKRALAPGTLGAYLEDMVAPLVGARAADIAHFYSGNVSPRGIAPTIRIGSQPYGLLATTAFSLYDARAPIGGHMVSAFPAQLFSILDAMRTDFLTIAETSVPHATATHVASTQENFLRMLGTYAHSLDFGARFAVNASFSHRPAGGAAGNEQSPLGILQRFMAAALAAAGIPNEQRPLVNGTPIPPLEPIFDALGAIRPLGLRLLQKPKPAVVAIADEGSPAALAQLAAAALRDLRSASASVGALADPLIERLARNARLYTWLGTALDLLARETANANGALTPAIRAKLGSADGFSIATASDLAYVSKFSFLTLPLAQLKGALGLTFETALAPSFFQFLASRAVVDYLGDLVAGTTTFARRAQHDDLRARLAAHTDALQRLAALPPDAQRRVAAEHVDTVSHRLDAWLTGLAHQRLAVQRLDRPTGVHLAAFGFVHDLRPDEVEVPAPTNLPAAFKTQSGTVRTDPRNEGFVHAPSISHAIAAAVLRSTYVAESSSDGSRDVSNRMAVNLSSRRVRLALELIEGTRGGSTLAALLGYRLERALHDRTDAVYDDLVFGLRRAYPTATSVDPSSPDPNAVRQVVDGHAILETVQAHLAGATYRATGRLFDALFDGGRMTGYPWGLRAIPALNDARLLGFLQALDETADALDAVGDLALSESVYQLVRGNRLRASAVMRALSEGRAMPEPEIAAFPRTGAVVSHRYLAIVDAAQLPAGWSTKRPRALAEPRVNAWIGALLGPMARYAATVRIDGVARAVPLEKLGLCPLDLVVAYGGGGAADATALSWAAALAVATPAELAAAKTVAFEPVAHMLGRESLDHAIAICESLADVLGRAKALRAADLYADASGGAVDLADLRARVTQIDAALRALGNAMYALVLGASPPNVNAWLAADLGAAPANLDTKRAFSFLSDATAFGIGAGLPATWNESSTEVADLAARFVATLGALRDRVTALAASPIAGLDETACCAALAAVTGEAVPVVPTFAVVAAQMPPALAVDADALDQFCTTASFVRAPLRHLAQARDLAALGGTALRAPQVRQRGGAVWAGGELDLPATSPEVSCYTVLGAVPTAGTCAAVLVDGWTDLLPSATEISGVAVSYDQPDARPPQTMLLLVPPRVAGAQRRWAFDDVIVALDDTLDLAKIRAVEPEHLAASPYGLLLPMTVGEIVPRAAATAATGERVMLDFGTNG